MQFDRDFLFNNYLSYLIDKVNGGPQNKNPPLTFQKNHYIMNYHIKSEQEGMGIRFATWTLV